MLLFDGLRFGKVVKRNSYKFQTFRAVVEPHSKEENSLTFRLWPFALVLNYIAAVYGI